MKASIEDLASQMHDRDGLKIVSHFFDVDESKLSDPQKTNLYRIIQETIQNTLKHARASNLIIQMSLEDRTLILEVEDDGIGFDPRQLKDRSGIGLKNIESRIKYLNGKLTVESKAGGPTNFTIEMPIG
jgi:signal transduction histidine kinase